MTNIQEIKIQESFLELSKRIAEGIEFIEANNKELASKLLLAKYGVIDSLERVGILVDND